MMTTETTEGILLIDKPQGFTSFRLVQILRKKFGVKKIGHAGTLDPFATGVMVMLVGRRYTRMSDHFLTNEKEYLAEVYLGAATDTHDTEGTTTFTSPFIPSIEEIMRQLAFFQGEVEQTPPMFSAKKIGGKKLYDLARKGIEVERKAVKVVLETELIAYEYPYLHLKIACSKGTYIRSIAHDLGQKLGCGAHLTNLQRTRSGQFKLSDCINGEELNSSTLNLSSRLLTLPETMFKSSA